MSPACRALVCALAFVAAGAGTAAERTTAPVARVALEVVLDPHDRSIEVVARYDDARLDAFALHEGLTVRRAMLDGRPLRVAAERAVDGLRRWRLDPAGAGTLRIEYGGTLVPLDASIDHRRMLFARTPMASSAGSYLPAASHWYPRPAGLHRFEVALSLPGDQRGLVAGDLLVEETPAAHDGRYRARFAFPHPAEGIDLFAGPYRIDERVIAASPAEGRPQPLRIRTYFEPALAPLAAGYLEDSARYIERYARSIGAYPFGSFSIVSSPLPAGFGMPTLTYLGAAVLKLPFIRATSLGHEVLHNWWGNGVYVDDAGGNWAEGLTTFMADYAYREERSDDAAREMRLGWLRDLAALPPDAARPLTAFRARTHGVDAAIGYAKAATLFLMLRDRIGASAFDAGLRTFWTEHRFRTASWRDLQAAFERASGTSLDGFFEQWLERADAPAPRVAAARMNGSTLTLALEQTAPAYALELPIELAWGERRETRRVELSREHASVTLKVASPPDEVRLDPALRVWRRLDAAQLPPILRAWIVSDRPALAVVSPGLEPLAAKIAARFFEAAPHAVAARDLCSADAPTLVVGVHRDVDAQLALLGLARPPEVGAARGTVQVWTVTGSRPLAIVSVRDADALDALARPLPHYGSQSYLVFDGSRAIDRGTWPVSIPAISVQR